MFLIYLVSNRLRLSYRVSFLDNRNFLKDITFVKRKEKISFSEPSLTRTIPPLQGDIVSSVSIDAILMSNAVYSGILMYLLCSVLMVWIVYLTQDAEAGKGIGCSDTC